MREDREERERERKKKKEEKENRVMETEVHGVDAVREINGEKDFHSGFF